MKFFGTGILFFSLFPTSLIAQLSEKDSILYRKAEENTILLYHQYMKELSGVFNGSKYTGYPFPFKKGHPYFKTDQFNKGTIVYDDVFYPDVRLIYDEVADLVVAEDGIRNIQLISDRISFFSIGEDQFINTQKDSTVKGPLTMGFYQVIHKGKNTVLKKEVKQIQDQVLSVSEGVERFIESRSYYFIRKGRSIFPVKSQKALLDIYKDQREELQHYIKVNKLNFRKNAEVLIIRVSAYYEQLTV